MIDTPRSYVPAERCTDRITERGGPAYEQLKTGAAEHLVLEHLDAVDVAFDAAGVPGQGQAGDDGAEVAIDTGGEGMEAGQVVLPHGVEPVRRALTLALGKHGREGADVPGERVEFGWLPPARRSIPRRRCTNTDGPRA
ncbi:hypothetical protein AB0N06_31045 [Streptomyces sp. NPDC051020]|uniref:hypothetical protein n=1 Tax=Streptomyces sp. NPDC051020 TaxID=3155409 RepID=UPI00343B7458